ncbi:MAG: MCE family protein [Candidatus Omnitrophica bacterium]|nr:MCE family protein [Candidatus Omnitrophota bacterium]
MPKETNLEMKVGLFVVAAVVCLVAFIFSISDFSVFKVGTPLRVVFSYANGLKKNAPVRIAGVDAGHVRDIRIFFDTKEMKTRVAVDIWLEGAPQIPGDSKYLINQLGILGEKYLEVMPGVSREFVLAGAMTFGEDPVPMESITKMLSAIGIKLQTTLDSVNSGFLTDANKAAVAKTFGNIALISEGLKNGEGTAGLFLKDKKLYEDMAAITGALRNGEGTVGKLLMDKSVYQNLDEMTADLKANPWKLFYRPKGK